MKHFEEIRSCRPCALQTQRAPAKVRKSGRGIFWNVQAAYSTCRVNNWLSRWSTSKATGAKTSACRRASVRDCPGRVLTGQSLFYILVLPHSCADSIAIESVIAHDLAKGLDHLAMYWTKELAPLNKATGLWRSVGSSNLMSGFVLGFTPSSCFQAEQRCNRSLK